MALHQIRHASASWEGTLKEGGGSLTVESGVLKDVPYNWANRFADEPGTNPEELVGVAHAGCYTMFLSALLTNNDFKPARLETRASVHLEDGPTITRIDLDVVGVVPGIDEDTFRDLAEQAKEKCPVSKALAGGPEIAIEARLLN